MRVYYVSSGLEGCYNVRALLPLQANGWDGDRTSLVPGEVDITNKQDALRFSQVVVFHRPESPQKLEVMKTFKEAGKKIVYDNDDTYKDHTGVTLNKYLDKERLVKGLTKVDKLADECIKVADLVTCSTEFLAEEYRKLNPNVVVLPNCVDPFYYDEPLKNKTDRVRIGIIGSIGVTTDLDVFRPILEHFKDDTRIQFVFFSLPENRGEKLKGKQLISELYAKEYGFVDEYAGKFEWHTFVGAKDYYDKVNSLRLDINIIPRADNYFNRCKSNLKFLELSMFEVPTIAQGFPDGKSPYEIDPEDAKHMLIAKNQEEWIKHINTLVEDKKLREKMGKDAKKYVLKKYDINKQGVLWEKAYKKLLK